jgi:hypothetical protein
VKRIAFGFAKAFLTKSSILVKPSSAFYIVCLCFIHFYYFIIESNNILALVSGINTKRIYLVVLSCCDNFSFILSQDVAVYVSTKIPAAIVIFFIPYCVFLLFINSSNSLYTSCIVFLPKDCDIAGRFILGIFKVSIQITAYRNETHQLNFAFKSFKIF